VSAARLLVGAAVAAAAAALFVAGNDRDDSLAFFLAWLFLHVLYGCAVGSFWVLAVVLAAPPLLVALAGSNGDDTPLWLQAASVELFYGVPFAFLGVLGRRLWQARRPPVLPGADAREGRRP
jgi:ABC-type transport system involved in multi-copper enzyme maturation permease subunit